MFSYTTIRANHPILWLFQPNNLKTQKTLMSEPLHTRIRTMFVIWVMVLLFGGQGFRYSSGLIGYSLIVGVTFLGFLWLFLEKWDWKRTPLLMTMFAGWAAVSVFWSATPVVTFIATIILLATTTTAVIIAGNYSWVGFLKLMWVALTVNMVLSFGLEFYAAMVGGVHPVFTDLAELAEQNKNWWWSEGNLFLNGPLQGWLGNRNLFGFLGLLYAAVNIFLLLERKIPWVVGTVGLLVAAVVHLNTLSATITITYFGVGSILVAGFVLRRTPEHLRRTIAALTAGFGVLMGVLLLRYQEVLFGFLERDPSLSNRTSIWLKVSEFALQRPEGWGWVSYWPVWEYPYNTLVNVDRLPVAHAHNAYIDVWFQLGLIGVLLLVAMFTQIFLINWRGVEHSHKGDDYRTLGLVVFALILAVQGFTESRLLLEGNWFLFTVLLSYTPWLTLRSFSTPKLDEADNFGYHDRIKQT